MAPPRFCVRRRAVVGEKVLQRRQQKGSEAPALLTQMLEVSPLEERCEEPLREIAGIVRVRAAPANVSVERIPVGLAQCRQRRACRGRIGAAGGQHQAPPRGFE
jgi:hypothetical protein